MAASPPRFSRYSRAAGMQRYGALSMVPTNSKFVMYADFELGGRGFLNVPPGLGA